jgi:hypothetical protein
LRDRVESLREGLPRMRVELKVGRGVEVDARGQFPPEATDPAGLKDEAAPQFTL